MTIKYVRESSEELLAANASDSSSTSRENAESCSHHDPESRFRSPSLAFKIDTIHEEEADEGSTSTSPTTCSESCSSGSSGFIYEANQTCPVGASALDDHTTRYHQQGDSKGTSTGSSGKRAVWKDKNGKARYTLHDDAPPKLEQPKQNAGKAVAAAAVTAGVVTGSVVGLVVLGPLGLVVGGVGGVASGASALITKRQFRRRQQQRQQNTFKKNSGQGNSTNATSSNSSKVAPLPAPPGRTFSDIIKVST